MGAQDATSSGSHARWVLGLAFLLILFNYIDRQILVSMFPYPKAEWQLSDTEFGALAMAVSLAIGVGTLPISLLIARLRRTRALAVMGVTWSLATIIGAATSGFAQLFAARLMIGLGQAGYVPAAGALLCDVFPRRRHGAVLAAFQSAALFGSVLGVFVGGVLATQFGWRSSCRLSHR